MKSIELRGLYPATVTPFDENMEIDVSELDLHLNATCEADGVQGIVVNGHVGEVLALTSQERLRVVERAVVARREGQRVFAGVEARTAAELVRDGVNARDAGADGLLVIPPIDVRPYRRLSSNPSSVLHYFEALNDQVGLPMIVHQYPVFTGSAYSLPVLRELVALENVIAIKAAAFTVTRYAELWDTFSEDVSILAATDAPSLLGMLLHGCHGALIGVSVIEPSAWAQVVQSSMNGDAENARKIFREICMPLLAAVFENQEPTGFISEASAAKEALVQLGQLKSSSVRLPAVPVDSESRSKIAEALRRTGLIAQETFNG